MTCNDNMIRIQDISYSSSVDGEGFRDVLFVNYCPHHCPGCHNPETWDEEKGTWETIDQVYNRLMKSSITDVTFSGGEPFCQSETLYILGNRLIEAGKTIWIYSGYLYEDIIKDENRKRLLSICDVLVDGHFIENLKEENLRFKGSTNQRIIDIKKSINMSEFVLWQDDFI